jgi:hypothetical protein
MDELQIFINRLSKIGIKVQFVANYPWIYLDRVQNKMVQGTFQGNHGFTAFFLRIRNDDPVKYRITDISTVFKKIREYL